MSEALRLFFATSKATPIDLIIFQSYIDGVFRLIILIYALSLSILAFTKGYLVITLIVSILITMSIAYAYYTLATVGAILIQIDGYNVFNLVFYYIGTSMLAILFIAITYLVIKPFKTKVKFPSV